jgi:uncharacterized integral membrane protein
MFTANIFFKTIFCFNNHKNKRLVMLIDNKFFATIIDFKKTTVAKLASKCVNKLL